MGSCRLADGMEGKEVLIFTRIDPSLSIYINFIVIGHKLKRESEFLHCSVENRNFRFAVTLCFFLVFINFPTLSKHTTWLIYRNETIIPRLVSALVLS